MAAAPPIVSAAKDGPIMNEKYLHALKRELASSRGKKNAHARDEILAELARHGVGETVRTATTDQPVKRGPGRPKKQAE